MCRDRAGTVLLAAAGLAAIMAALAVTLLARMRADSRESDLMTTHTQARLMLSGALMFLQESSRLGWDGYGGVGVDTTGETFGWTDARDGALGPRGARPPAGTISADGTNFDPAASSIVPTWWTAHYAATPPYRPYVTSAEEANPTLFPAPSRRRWPLPGSAIRCDMPVWTTPPCAIRQRYSANPIRPPVAYGDPTWDSVWQATYADDQLSGGRPFSVPAPWLADVYNPNQGALGVLDPQPVADTWAAFTAGDPTLRPGCQGLGWFRVYRELLSDHDNDPGNDLDYGILGGDVAQITARSVDHVALYDPTDTTSVPPLRNYSVFIIACGGGGSRGFRWWSLLGNDPRRALEPVTAQESGLFPSEAVFNLIRQNEVVQWFRVEHTARAAPGEQGYTTGTNYGDGWQRARVHSLNRNGDFPWHGGGSSMLWNNSYAAGTIVKSLMTPGATGRFFASSDTSAKNHNTNFGGGFTWIQRLDREPVKW